MRKYLLPVILTVTLVLAVTACGDDDFGGGFGENQTPTPGFGDGDLTIPTSVGNIPGLSGECEAYANLAFAMSAAFTGQFTGFEGDLVSNLPAEAQADAVIIVDALQEFSDGLAGAGIDMSQGMAGFSQEEIETFSDLSEAVFTDEVDAAFEGLGEVMEDACEVDGDF